ncbi:hypothetical protein D3C71_2111050 [compost metagenome]
MFTGISQFPDKLISLFEAISDAAIDGALDGEEMDAFITLIKKRRNEAVHGPKKPEPKPERTAE